MCFSNLQISKNIIPKNYPGLEISISRQFQYTVIGGKFKFQVQDSFLEYFSLKIWRFEKQIALSERKPPLTGGNKLTQINYMNDELARPTNSFNLQWIQTLNQVTFEYHLHSCF